MTQHADKIVFGLLLALTVWYGVARARGMARGERERADIVREAERVRTRINEVAIPPPEKEPAEYAEEPKRQWEDIPGNVPELTPRFFYPKGRKKPSTRY